METLRTGQTATQLSDGFVCLADIDHFKQINDTDGHQTGDEVLRSFARNIRSAIRVCDGLGRVGGEEFLILLATGDAQEAEDVMARVFDAIRTNRPIADRPISDRPEICVTMSAGMARITPSDPEQAIYARCDASRYRTKFGGRDRLAFDRDEPLNCRIGTPSS